MLSAPRPPTFIFIRLLALQKDCVYNIYIKKLLSESGTINEAYIALGGNIGDVVDSIKQALSLLSQPPIIQVIAISSIYRTEPVGGPEGQPDYDNAVARIGTSLSPAELLAHCLDIERQLGRERRERWGPRTIDLDLILFADCVVDEPGLTLPHPRLRERLFVLVPLNEIAPINLQLPGDEPISTVLDLALASSKTSIAEFQKKIILPKANFGTN
jgi:2-amino-4-hydroxy-6-hydroxymethyldihydropteridine diphosphokinase